MVCLLFRFVLKTEFIPAKYRAYLLPLGTVSSALSTFLSQNNRSTEALCVSDLLDDRLHAHHPPWHAGGSHYGLEMDDSALHHTKHHPHLPLQGAGSAPVVCFCHACPSQSMWCFCLNWRPPVYSWVGPLQRVSRESRCCCQNPAEDRQNEPSFSSSWTAGGACSGIFCFLSHLPRITQEIPWLLWRLVILAVAWCCIMAQTMMQ